MNAVTNKLFNILEDPNQHFIGRNIKLLKMCGLLLPENNRMLKNVYILAQSMVVLFIVTQYIDMYMSRSDILSILRNIKYTIFATVNVIKVITFLSWQKKWKAVHQFIVEVDFERRKTQEMFFKNVYDKFSLLNKVITYLYFYLTYGTIVLIILQPIAQFCLSSTYRDNLRNGTEKRLEVISSWFPFDKENNICYLFLLIIQTLSLVYSGGWITSYDTNAITLMIFIRTELELLRKHCQILFGTEDKPITQDEARTRREKCHKRHNGLLTCTRLFNTCLSPVMLLYVVMCSSMLCATAYQFTIETSSMQKVITAEFLIFAVAQLFLYCWYSNDVFYVSKDLMLGPYESIWWTRTVSEHRDIIILTDQFNKILVFSAGPFTSITVTSFINILKGAYSYYTLLSQSQEH